MSKEYEDTHSKFYDKTFEMHRVLTDPNDYNSNSGNQLSSSHDALYSIDNGNNSVMAIQHNRHISNDAIRSERLDSTVSYADNTSSLKKIHRNEDSLFGNSLDDKTPSRLGNLYTLMYNGESTIPLIVISPSVKPIAVCMTMLLIHIGLNFLILSKIEFLFFLSSNILYGIHLISFIYNFLCNPGIPDNSYYLSDGVIDSMNSYLENTEKKTFDKYKICKKCNIYIESNVNVVHCQDCEICILDLHHHCKFFEKCLNKRNVFYMNVFIYSTCCWIGFYLIMIVRLAIMG